MNDKYDYSKKMPFYCIECSKCIDYQESDKYLKVKNVGYGCKDIICLKQNCIVHRI